MSEPSKEAFALIAACEAVHFGDGLCAECVDAALARLAGERDAARTRSVLANAGWKETVRQLEAAEQRGRTAVEALAEFLETDDVRYSAPANWVKKAREALTPEGADGAGRP